MSDYGDFCREQRAHKQDVKRRQSAENFRFVEQMIALGFTESPLPGGLRLTRGQVKVDFWPSSGKFCVVGSGRYQQGGRKMINYVKNLGEAEKHSQETKWAGQPTGEGNPPWKI